MSGPLEDALTEYQRMQARDAEIERLQAEIRHLRVILEGCEKIMLERKTEIERLRSALAIMWHAWDSDNRPPHYVLKIARECYEQNRRK